MPSSKTIQENTMPLQVSSPRDSSAETMGDKLNRKVCPCSLLLSADYVHMHLLQGVVHGLFFYQ